MTFTLHEIFETLQGEGRNTGRPCIFVRFSGCNLACPWCDTDFSPKFQMKREALVDRLAASKLRSIIFTGGEPLLQSDLLPLARDLKARGFWLGVETNGTLEPAPELRALLDYIATSPKAGAPLNLKAAHEVRLVVTKETPADWCRAVRAQLPAEDYYLSPCDVGGKLLIHDTLLLLGELNADAPAPPWRLSLQTHKLAGIP